MEGFLIFSSSTVLRPREAVSQGRLASPDIMLSHVSHAGLSVTSWTVGRQAPLSMDFSRQEYWSGLPFPSPGDLPDPGIEPESPYLRHWQAGSLPLAPPGKLWHCLMSRRCQITGTQKEAWSQGREERESRGERRLWVCHPASLCTGPQQASRTGHVSNV